MPSVGDWNWVPLEEGEDSGYRAGFLRPWTPSEKGAGWVGTVVPGRAEGPAGVLTFGCCDGGVLQASRRPGA